MAVSDVPGPGSTVRKMSSGRSMTGPWAMLFPARAAAVLDTACAAFSASMSRRLKAPPDSRSNNPKISRSMLADMPRSIFSHRLKRLRFFQGGMRCSR